MKEFTDDKIKQNLGLDIEQLMTQIVEEMNIDDDVDNDNNNGKMIYTFCVYVSIKLVKCKL